MAKKNARRTGRSGCVGALRSVPFLVVVFLVAFVVAFVAATATLRRRRIVPRLLRLRVDVRLLLHLWRHDALLLHLVELRLRVCLRLCLRTGRWRAAKFGIV